MKVSNLEAPWVGADMPSDIRYAFLDPGGFTFKIGLKIGLFQIVNLGVLIESSQFAASQGHRPISSTYLTVISPTCSDARSRRSGSCRGSPISTCAAATRQQKCSWPALISKLSQNYWVRPAYLLPCSMSTAPRSGAAMRSGQSGLGHKSEIPTI